MQESFLMGYFALDEGGEGEVFFNTEAQRYRGTEGESRVLSRESGSVVDG